uniref:BMA-RAD-26 n=3 Tax=Brugia TaxID=6278 RepID=A0A0H5S6R1_BRUMA|nr:BMA-RAD-26 [Brugia malayi]
MTTAILLQFSHRSSSWILCTVRMEENGMKAKLEVEFIKNDNPVESVIKNNSADELISLTLPTQTRSNKRKHIRTDFDEIKVSFDAVEAQRQERERLERLSKIYESEIGDFVEAQYREGLSASEDPYVKLEPVSKYLKTSSLPDVKPSTSFIDDVIELSSDDDSDVDCRPLDLIQPLPLRRRSSLYRVVHEDVTDELHRVERERLCKKLLTEEELESKNLMGGRLLVNPGKATDEADVYVPFHLNDVLQPHQLGGIRFMYGNIIESAKEYEKSAGFGCILAHAMGLGKTIQIIAFTDIFVRTTNAKKILIIVPVNTILNWYSEFEKWLPNRANEAGENIRPFVVWLLGDAVKTNEQRAELIQKWHTEGGVLLIGYDMFRLLVQIKPKKRVTGRPNKKTEEIVDLEKEELDAMALCAAREALLDPGPDLVVCDEGHRIKNERTGIAAALSAIKTRRRIVLTGYPLQNNLMEYYCMVDFVRPHYLGSKKEFSVMFEKPIKNGLCIDSTPSDLKIGRQRTHVLIELLKGFVQRRTHHLLKNTLPPSSEFVILLRKSPVQRMLYRAFLQYAQNEISVSGTAVFNPLKAFAVCSKIWNHPDILYEVFQKRKIEYESGINEKNAQCAAPEAATDDLTDSALSLALIDSSTLPTVLSDPTTLQSSLDSFSYDSKSFFDEKFSADDLDTILQDTGGMCLAVEETSQIAPSFSVNDSANAVHFAVNAISHKMGVRSKHSTIANALLEELNLDKGIKYDWATFALHGYKPGVLENGYKMVVSLAIIEQAVLNGEKVLLFSQSLLTLNQIERFLETSSSVTVGNEKLRWKKSINYYRFDGSTTATEREKLINRFNQDPNILLFLISTRAGSLGINLVSASRVIIFDASWNPCHDAQAVCRIYRYGQKRRTYVYRLIMDNSMERAIFSRQIGKNGLQQRVVDDKQMDIDITKREMEQLLVYDESLDVATEEWNITTWQIDDALLWMTALSHSKMFSQIPFLHESLLMEREDRLSEEEKLEARMLYEREKQIYKNGDFDYDWTLRSGGGRSNEFEGPRMSFPRIWPSASQQMHDPMPLRPTPMAMILERTMENLNNEEPTATSEEHSNIHAKEIISDREMELPCLTAPGQKGKVKLHEKCWLVTLPSGIFIRSLRGDVYDARGTVYDKSRYKTGKGQNSFAPSEVIDLCDSD